ncbi:hypothetical protein, partial [Streptomyces sp. NPDC059409]|uniref:hypothetical protein n=1 Tax=Streptomyces sp. NPDC059409 TaxID=3346824 RepID=UPI00369C840C
MAERLLVVEDDTTLRELLSGHQRGGRLGGAAGPNRGVGPVAGGHDRPRRVGRRVVGAAVA